VHGDASQDRAVWHTLAWATANPDVDGVIVGESGDYARMTGLRAASGRTRRVVATLNRATRGLREAVVP
jgi:ABC-type sugar transport system substrate-binding protein